MVGLLIASPIFASLAKRWNAPDWQCSYYALTMTWSIAFTLFEVEANGSRVDVTLHVYDLMLAKGRGFYNHVE